MHSDGERRGSSQSAVRVFFGLSCVVLLLLVQCRLSSAVQSEGAGKASRHEWRFRAVQVGVAAARLLTAQRQLKLLRQVGGIVRSTLVSFLRRIGLSHSPQALGVCPVGLVGVVVAVLALKTPVGLVTSTTLAGPFSARVISRSSSKHCPSTWTPES